MKRKPRTKNEGEEKSYFHWTLYMECALADILRDEHNLSHNADIIAEKWEIFASISHLYQQ